MNNSTTVLLLSLLVLQAGCGCRRSSCQSVMEPPQTAVEKSSPEPEAEEKPHTPEPGSAERLSILDGLRAHYGRPNDQKVLFIVRRLKVNAGWAWIHGLPEDEDGNNRYEDVSALLKHTGGAWEVVEVAGGEEESLPEEAYIEDLLKRRPEVPTGIFY